MMNVLSLFDGMGCGITALKRARIEVNNYYASEIDKYAMIICNKNHPEVVQLGDINDWHQWGIPPIDLIIGGSPCQGFSFAGKQLAFDDPRSKLFFKFVEVLNQYKPKYFLLENVRMKKEYQQVITDLLGVEPIVINSSLVSAQNRVRYYWVGKKIETKCREVQGEECKEAGGLSTTIPNDAGRQASSAESGRKSRQGHKKESIYSSPLHEETLGFLEVLCMQCNQRFDDRPQNAIEQEWSQYTGELAGFMQAVQLKKTYFYTRVNITQPKNKNIIVDDILDNSGIVGRMTGRRINSEGKREDYNINIPSKQRFEPRNDDKSGCLTTVQKDNLIFMGNANINAYRQRKAVYSPSEKSPSLLAATGGNHHTKISINNEFYRNLTPIECERLQTLPDNYTEGVSNTQRYKMLGNGWTVDVIAHILSLLPHQGHHYC
jgi:DNA (cytosine-5)-methyltransferase 3A